MRAMVVAVLLGGLLPMAAGCGSDCDDVGCGGQGLYVEWDPDAVPEGDGHRLCADDVCEVVEASPAQIEEGRPGFEVSVRSPAERGDDIAGRLEVLDADGTVIARYEGVGERRGRCCSAASLVVEGRRLVEAPG